MESFPPTIVIMIGTIIGSILAFVGLRFSSIADHLENVCKLRSEWIDRFQKDISSFSARVTTLSLIWNVELKAKNVDSLTDQDFCFFRNKHKEWYRELFESYSSIVLHLNSGKDDGIAQRILLDETVNSFTGNNSSCGLDSKEKLSDITKKAEEVIKRERSIIELEIPKQQKKHFISNLLIVIFVVFFGVATLVSIYSATKDLPNNEEPPATEMP